ncbi:MAG: hypothetical protein PHR26_04225 [Candidatus ainarchaeum sp.]|nr:hypothetical protein [Candidatus ainarchaeum sp.]
MPINSPIGKKLINKKRDLLSYKIYKDMPLRRIFEVNFFKEFKDFKINYNTFKKEYSKTAYPFNFRQFRTKSLAYDLSFKKLLSENKGIISSFLKLIKDPSLKKIKDPKGNYLISKSLKSIDKFKSENSLNTGCSYFLLIKDKSNKINKFYIKQARFDTSPPSFEEFICLKFLESIGFDIISILFVWIIQIYIV